MTMPARRRRTVPALWNVRRAMQLGLLVAAGIAQAAAALGMSFAASDLVGMPLNAAGHTLMLLGGSTLAAIGLAIGQSWLAERFAVSYVHELRLSFMETVLLTPRDGRARKFGHVMTRVVNDMSAIKLWLSRGLVSIVATAAMLATIAVWLAMTGPDLAAALAMAVAAWLACAVLVLLPLTAAIRETRRRRGSVAGFSGTLLQLRYGLLTKGRGPHSMRVLGRKSDALGQALSRRAIWSGAIRATALPIVPLVIVLMAQMTAAGDTQTGHADFALQILIASFVAAQLATVAAGFEYFQGARIAMQKLTSILAVPTLDPDAGERLQIGKADAAITVRGLALDRHSAAISFTAAAGEIVLLEDFAPQQISALFDALSGLNSAIPGGCLRIGGADWDGVRRRDIWKTVAVLSPEIAAIDPAAVLAGQRPRSARVSPDEARDIWSALAGETSSIAAPVQGEPMAQDGLMARIAEVLMRGTPILLIDDPQLMARQPLLETVLSYAQAQGKTVLLAGAPEDAHRLRRFGPIIVPAPARSGMPHAA